MSHNLQMAGFRVYFPQEMDRFEAEEDRITTTIVHGKMLWRRGVISSV